MCLTCVPNIKVEFWNKLCVILNGCHFLIFNHSESCKSLDNREWFYLCHRQPSDDNFRDFLIQICFTDFCFKIQAICHGNRTPKVPKTLEQSIILNSSPCLQWFLRTFPANFSHGLEIQPHHGFRATVRHIHIKCVEIIKIQQMLNLWSKYVLWMHLKPNALHPIIYSTFVL